MATTGPSQLAARPEVEVRASVAFAFSASGSGRASMRSWSVTDLFDVGAEALAIDRAVEDPRGGQPRDPQRGEKRAGLPAPAGGVVVDARATRCPAVPPKQIGGAAGFVQTHEVGDIPGRRRRVPRDPRGRDVRPIVFGRPDRFF